MKLQVDIILFSTTDYKWNDYTKNSMIR